MNPPKLYSIPTFSGWAYSKESVLARDAWLADQLDYVTHENCEVLKKVQAILRGQV